MSFSYTLRRSSRFGNSICPQFLAYSTLILTVLAMLVQAYENDGMPSRPNSMSVDDEYDGHVQENYSNDSEENDSKDINDTPYVNKRFFREEGLRYPLIYRKGRIPIRRVMSKKALGLFTRWRGGTPYTSGAGLQDAGSEDVLGARDIVSAVSRAGGGRPIGQPLRWGK